MRWVICKEDEIADWIYLDARTSLEGESVNAPDLDKQDFIALWQAIGFVSGSSRTGEHALVDQSSHCDVGYPHDAPDFVDCVNPDLISELLAIPSHDRWRVAKQWASIRLSKHPTESELAFHKNILRAFAELAARAEPECLFVLLYWWDDTLLEI